MSRVSERVASLPLLHEARIKPFVWVIVVVCAVLLGLLVVVNPTYAIAAIIVLALSTACLANRELTVGAILVSSLVTLGAIEWLGVPGRATYLVKLLIFLLVVGVFLDWPRGKKLIVPGAFVVLAASLVVSALFGTGSRFLAAQAFVSYVAAPVTFLAIMNSELKLGSLKRLSLLVLGIVAAQIPIMFLQARIVSNVDDVGGTFGMGGSTQALAIVLGTAWTVAVALLTRKKAWWLIPIGLSIGSALMVSQAKAGFLFMAAGTFVVGLAKAILSPRGGITRFLVYMVLGVAALAALFYSYVFFGPLLPGGSTDAYYWTHWLSDPSQVMNYLMRSDSSGQAGRLGGTVLVWQQAHGTVDRLIGQGLGLLSDSVVSGESSGASAIAYALGWATSLTRFLLEVGIVGVLAYLVAVWSGAVAVVRAWRPGCSSTGISVGAAAMGAAAIFIAGALYHPLWTTDAVAVPYWALLGIAVRWGILVNPPVSSVVRPHSSATETPEPDER